MARNETKFIVVHCAATKPTMDVGAKEIRAWHTDPKDNGDGTFRYLRKTYNSVEELPEAVRDKRGRGWSDIGYHFVIKRDGTIETGRALDAQGAHVAGHNHHSVGICLVGGVDDDNNPENNYTKEQMKALRQLVEGVSNTYREAEVVGHHYLYPGKACPCFNVRNWWARKEEYAPVV